MTTIEDMQKYVSEVESRIIPFVELTAITSRHNHGELQLDKSMYEETYIFPPTMSKKDIAKYTKRREEAKASLLKVFESTGDIAPGRYEESKRGVTHRSSSLIDVKEYCSVVDIKRLVEVLNKSISEVENNTQPGKTYSFQFSTYDSDGVNYVELICHTSTPKSDREVAIQYVSNVLCWYNEYKRRLLEHNTSLNRLKSQASSLGYELVPKAGDTNV